MHTRIKLSLLATLLSLINVMVILRGFIFNSGFVFYRDLRWPLTSSYFKTIASYVWNPFLQRPSINVLNQAPMHMFLSLFNPLVSERLIFAIIIVVATITSFYATYKLTRSVLGAVIASVVFVYNPVVINRFHHKFMVLSYSLLPLVVLISHRMTIQIRQRKSLPLWYILALSMLLVIITHSAHFVIFALSISLVVSLTTLCLTSKSPGIKVSRLIALLLTSYVVTASLYLAMEAFFILPLAMFILNKHAVLPYVLNIDELYLLNRDNYLINVLRLIGYWWPSDAYSSIPSSIKHIMYIALFVYPSILIAALLTNSRDKELEAIKTSMLVIALVAIVLAGGVHTLGSAYLYIVLKMPMGWVLRDPYKLSFILALCYSLLSGIVISEAERVLKGKSSYALLALCWVFVSLILFANMPLLTGNLGGVFTPEKVNASYILRNYEDSHGGPYHWMVYPPTPWYPTVFTISSEANSNFVVMSLSSGRICSVIKLLNATGIKFLAFRKVLFSYDRDYAIYMIMHKIVTRLSRDLCSSTAMKLCGYSVIKNSAFSIYKVLGNAGNVEAFNSFFIALGGDLYVVYSWLSESSIPLVISIYGHEDSSISKVVSSATGVVIKSSYDSIELDYDALLGKKGLILTPSKYVYHHDPSKYWSKGFTYDPLHGEWHPYLSMLGIDNWQSGYGYGLAFTWAKAKLNSLKCCTTKASVVASWDFNSDKDCIAWRRYTPSKQCRALQLIECHNGLLEIELFNSTWGWKIVESPLIPIDPYHTYLISLRIKGVNAHKVHIKIAEFSRNKELIDVKYAKYVGDGTFNWKNITIIYIPSDSDVHYIQVQIWHGHLTNKPLPNTIYVDYVKVRDITSCTEYASLSIPFKVENGGAYKLFMRILESSKGGTIRVYLDGKPISAFNTHSQLDRFVWKYVGTYYLSPGKHVITIENAYGFNAVNLILLIPPETHHSVLREVDNFLKDKEIIYIFEAETDMFRVNAKVATILNASNDKVLHLNPNGYAWQRFEILENGYYMIAIKLKGLAKVRIDNKDFVVNSDALRFNYLGPIYIKKGVHTISVKASQKPLYLDVLWVYRVKSPSLRMTLENLSTINRGYVAVISYECVNPSSWKVKVRAAKPFLLVFMDSYDLLWKAKVYKDGRLIDEVKSMPIYSFVNGFWINATGDLTVVIEYAPQNLLELGSRISIATFTSCILYCILWLWIKKLRSIKGDRGLQR